MSDHAPTLRAEPLTIRELRRLRRAQPGLSAAVDLQLELLDLQQRVLSRVPSPRGVITAAEDEQAAAGPTLRFEEIPLEWSDLRLLMARIADLLRRHGTLSETEAERVIRLTQDATRLEPLVEQWFGHGDLDAALADVQDAPGVETVESVVHIAMRPFLMRCAEVAFVRHDFSTWGQRTCPMCGGEPEFGVIRPDASAWLSCTRCWGQWPFESLRCAHCDNRDRLRLTTFASADGDYRLAGCQVCQRYMKYLDQRTVGRGLLLGYDVIATLPLDVAAMQRGFTA